MELTEKIFWDARKQRRAIRVKTPDGHTGQVVRVDESFMTLKSWSGTATTLVEYCCWVRLDGVSPDDALGMYFAQDLTSSLPD